MKNMPGILKSKYLYLLMILIFHFVISPFFIQNQLIDFFTSLAISLFVLLSINIIAREKFLLVASIILGSIAITSYWIINFTHPLEQLYVIFYLSILLFLLLVTFYVIYSVAHQAKITPNTLLGAICGYLLIGLTWGELYLLLSCLDPNAFSGHPIFASIRDHTQHYVYFSFETLTTLGYGDILPQSDIARTFSWLEAVTGQIYLAVWISQLVGLRIAQMIKDKIDKNSAIPAK